MQNTTPEYFKTTHIKYDKVSFIADSSKRLMADE